MHKHIAASLVGLFGVVGLSAFAVTEVEWDQFELPTSLADGKVTAAYDDNGCLTNLVTDPKAASGLTFVGYNMTFSPEEGVIKAISAGEMIFSNGLAQTGVSKDALAKLDFCGPIATETSLTLDAPPEGGGWRTLVTGMDLADIEDVSLPINNYNMPHRAFVWAQDGNSFVCEFQHWFSSATVRAIIIEFRKTGNTLEYHLLGYRHLTDYVQLEGDEKSCYHVFTGPNDCEESIYYNAYPSHWPAGLGYSIVKNVYNGVYAPTGPMVVTFNKPIPLGNTTFNLASENSLNYVAMSLGKTVEDTVTIGHINALPMSGSVEIGPKGVLELSYPVGSDVLCGCDHGVPITVRKGGVLKYTRTYQLNVSSSHVILDGGELRGTNLTGDPGYYIKNITFQNGGKTTGTQFRVRSQNAVWKVTGSLPCRCESGFTAWRGVTNKEGVFTLDVEDVTGDAAADFIVTGPITRGSAGTWNEINVTKSGAGTMSVQTSYGLDTRPTTISGGVMEFANGVIGADVAFIINGGTLAVTASSVNSCKSLTLSGNGGLTVGDGASLEIGDSSALEWSGAAKLLVTADLAQSSIRFGTSSSGLTSAQLKRIDFAGGGFSAALDDNGYLYKIPKPGMVLIIK